MRCRWFGRRPPRSNRYRRRPRRPTGPTRRGQLPNHGSVVGLGRDDHQLQQVPQGIDREVGLAAGALFSPVPVAPAPRSGVLGSVWLSRMALVGRSARRPAQQHPQVVRHGREAAGMDPAVRLLGDDLPRWGVGRQVAPLSTGEHDPAPRGGDLTRIVAALRGVGPQQDQIGSDERPSSSETSEGYGLRANDSILQPTKIPNRLDLVKPDDADDT